MSSKISPESGNKNIAYLQTLMDDLITSVDKTHSPVLVSLGECSSNLDYSTTLTIVRKKRS
jgi:esterase/lipase